MNTQVKLEITADKEYAISQLKKVLKENDYQVSAAGAFFFLDDISYDFTEDEKLYWQAVALNL